MRKWFSSKRGKEDNAIITPRYQLGDASYSSPTGVPGDAVLAGKEQGKGVPAEYRLLNLPVSPVWNHLSLTTTYEGLLMKLRRTLAEIGKDLKVEESS